MACNANTVGYALPRYLAATVLLLGAASPLRAQQVQPPPPGSFATPSLRVTGRLVDGRRFPALVSIPKPTVTLLKTPYTVVGDSTGHFVLVGHLPPGCYELRVQARGYRTVYKAVRVDSRSFASEFMLGPFPTLPSSAAKADPGPPPCKDEE